MHHGIYAIRTCPAHDYLPRSVLVGVLSDNRKIVGMLAMKILYEKLNKKSQPHTCTRSQRNDSNSHWYVKFWNTFVITWSLKIDGQNVSFDLCSWKMKLIFWAFARNAFKLETIELLIILSTFCFYVSRNHRFSHLRAQNHETTDWIAITLLRGDDSLQC